MILSKQAEKSEKNLLKLHFFLFVDLIDYDQFAVHIANDAI